MICLDIHPLVVDGVHWFIIITSRDSFSVSISAIVVEDLFTEATPLTEGRLEYEQWTFAFSYFRILVVFNRFLERLVFVDSR